MPDELINQIKYGSIYLFLGQNYFHKRNPLIDIIKNEYCIDDQPKSHDVFLQLKDINCLKWASDQADMILTPKSLEIIARLPWNGVITSSVDQIITRTFRNNWREVQNYCNANYPLPGSVSNREKLIVSELFSNITCDYGDVKFPSNPMDFLKANMNATLILAKYTEQFKSPMTTIILDGYDPEDDWLTLEQLLPHLPSNPGQVHYFGKSIVNNTIWLKLVEQGIIIEHPQTVTLATYLFEQEAKGNIDFEELLINHTDDKLLTIHKIPHYMPKQVYNDVSQDCIILDDTILMIDDLPEREVEEQFRNFLYQSSTSPVWSGYKWGFYFHRDAENILVEKIESELNKNNIHTKPIILEGQSGSGKSVLLGKIAYHYKNKCEYPILFIPHTSMSISYDNILGFCNWLESIAKVKKIIIIWDASVYNDEISQYINLNNFLQSAGKNIIIIGSSLKISDRLNKKIYQYISVPLSIEISSYEKDSIYKIFNKFSGKLIDTQTFDSLVEESIFVACYRLLPPSRFNLRRGIVDEGKKNAITLKDAMIPSTPPLNNPFIELFQNTKVYISDTFMEPFGIDLKDLLEYICVPAQLGCMIPFNLLLRCFDHNYGVTIAKKIDEIDFFKFIEMPDGDWFIGARSNLEAELILDSELSSVQKQIEIISRLIQNICENEYLNTKNSEIDFLIQLLKGFGPNGRKRENYAEFYKDIANELSCIRQKGVYDSRTILQEALLLREYAKNHDEEKMELMKQAQILLEQEIDRIRHVSKESSRPHLGRMYCELASNEGSQICEQLKKSNINWIVIEKGYRHQQEVLQYAREFLPESFYALDICAWTSKEILQHTDAPKSLKQDVYVFTRSLYEIAALTTPMLISLSEYNLRLLQLSNAYGDEQISQSAFDRLLKLGSGVGIYLRAIESLQGIDLNAPLQKEKLQIFQYTLEFLEQYQEIISKDIHCLYLLFKLKWIIYTEYPLFYKEKQKIRLNQIQWSDIYLLIEKILNLTPDRENIVLKYVRAMALFHLNKLSLCWSAFNDICHLPYPSHKRIIMSYIATDSNGEPLKYQGRLRLGNDRRTFFYIDQLKKEIPYFNFDFAQKNQIPEKLYEDIELGFNFLGVQVSKIGRGY